MTTLDLAAFLVAGGLGVFYDQRLAWGVVGLWALLKLLHVL